MRRASRAFWSATVQDFIWIGVSVGFVALSLLYIALADKA